MKVSQRIGKRIKELRARAGLSQEQLGERADITGKYVGEVERGVVNVSAHIMERVAVGLGVEMTDLLSFGHVATREELEADLARMMADADDEKLRLIWRLVRDVTR